MANTSYESAKVAELIAQDRHRLLLRFPFTGAVIMRLDVMVGREPGVETASTNGHSIKVNQDFYASLNDDERLFVLAHETWHCILMHFARQRDRDHKLFNAAADLEIHFLLTKEGLRPPFALPHSPSWNGLSAEEIYERLQRQQSQGAPQGSGKKPNNGGGEKDRHCGGGDEVGRKTLDKSGGNGAAARHSPQPSSEWMRPGVESAHIRSRDGQGFDRHDMPSEGEERDAVEQIRQIVVSAAQTVERMRGELPGHIARAVKTMLQPEFDWRAILARFVTSCYGGGRRWLPPSRRHVHRGLYLPSMRQDRLRAVVAIDTSGSTAKDLTAFFTELSGLLNSFGGYTVTVLQCDHAIQHVRTFSSDDGPLPTGAEWKARGFGGTSFAPIFDYVAKHSELEPSMLVYFTDGYGDAPAKAPPYPVLWVLARDGRPPAPWGAVTRFRRN